MKTMNNPWTCLREKSPYVLECDQQQIDAFNNTKNLHDDHKIHHDLFPEPYLGDPEAPVVILSLNPGYSPDDVKAHTQSSFAQASRDNLLHNRMRYPLHLLDPELPSSGQKWWRRRFGALARHVGWESVACNVFVAEYFPYHTRKYAHCHLRLSSQDYTFSLVRRALQRKAFIICFRHVPQWHLTIPELKTYSRSVCVKNRQNPTVSHRNLQPDRFDEILAEINAHRH